MHSGTSFQPWLLMSNVPEVSKQFAQLLGCPLNTSKEMVDCLRQRPAFAITSLHPQTMVRFFLSINYTVKYLYYLFVNFIICAIALLEVKYN